MLIMDICKGPEKLSVYQPSFMIDDLLTRKAIDQNGGGDYSTSIPLDSVVGRRRENGDTLHSNGRVAVDRRELCISRTDSHSSENISSCSKRESTSTSGGEDDEDGFRKRKKPRTAFSREQVGDLEKKFQEKKYLSSAERGELAEKLKLSDMQVKTWFQNRRMKYKRQTEEAELEMKSPKYPTYPSFVPYGGFYSSYMPMAYKSDNIVHYPYPTLRSPPTPSGSSDSNFSPMNLTSPTHFSSLHSPLSRSSPRTPSTSYFPNTAGVLTPLTPSSTSPSPSPYHHHHHHPNHQPHSHHQTPHPAYFTVDGTTTSNNHPPATTQPAAAPVAVVGNGTQHIQQFTATAEWPRP